MSRRPRANEDTEAGFLKRWSRRKAGDVGSPDERVPESGDDGAGGGRDDESPRADQRPPDTGQERAEEPVKTDADMPDLDSISDTSDMSDFFSPGVSEKLRNQALRRLFRMSKFNVVDPLDDYNEDFRNFDLLGDLVTSDMRHRMDMDEQRRREAGQSSASAGQEPEDAEAVEDLDRTDREPGEVAEDAGSADAPAGSDDEESDTESDAPSRTRT